MKLTIIGSPRTKKNSQRIVQVKGRPVIIQSKNAVGWEASAVAQMKSATRRDTQGMWLPAEGPVSLRALVYRDRKVGDLGNYLAAVCDALERAGVVENDRLIQSFDGSRLLVDKKNPRVEIEIEPFEERES